MTGSWEIRRDAVRALGPRLPDAEALTYLTEALGDADTAVQQEAVEALVRFGGGPGLAAVLHELGRRAEDPDADYIAYRLRELEIFDQLAIIDSVRELGSRLSEEARAGLSQLESLLR